MDLHLPIQLPDLPPHLLSSESKKNIEDVKKNAQKLSDLLVKEFKEVIGVSLLPPTPKSVNPPPSSPIPPSDAMTVLVMLDLEDRKDWFKVRDTVIAFANEKAKSLDPSLVPFITDLFELREQCYDGRYELLHDIALGIILYDVRDYLSALRISVYHKRMVLQRFDKYIVSYVLVGSMMRGSKGNDIDVSLVVDDTDVKRMSRFELRDRLYAMIREMGVRAAEETAVKKAFHIQMYLLTDFWDFVKDAQPVIYTFLRDGVPIFDRGMFMPWKLLLKMGRIRPSPEAIDVQMDTGERMIKRAKGKLMGILGEDLYHAVLDPAQAALMLYGIAPPTPKETISLMEDIFVKKEKMLEKKYVDTLSKVRSYYKDLEHGVLKEVSGKQIDDLLKDAEDYLKRIQKLFSQIQKRRDKESILELYETCMTIVEDCLKLNDIFFNSKTNLLSAFSTHLVKKKIFIKKDLDILKQVDSLKKNYGKKKLSSSELEKIRREARQFIKIAVEYIQRKRGSELERVRVRFKHGDKFGEILLLDSLAFITEDVDAKEKKISRAVVKKDGRLGSLTETTLEEFEKHLASAKIPSKVFIKSSFFDDLRRIFGKDVEVLLKT